MKKIIYFLVAFLVVLTSVVSCTPEDKEVAPIIYSKTVMEYLRSDARFSTLVRAIERTNLVSVFNTATATDKTTLLAPDNTAFTLANIDVNTIDENVLKEVLLYHVPLVARGLSIGTSTAGSSGRNVFGNWVDLTQDAPNGAYLRMRNTASVAETPTVPTNNTNRVFFTFIGTPLNINTINGIVRFNFPNIFCNNGIIHGIDRVMMPASVSFTLYDIISANPDYSRFKYAVDKQASLVTDLKNAQLTRTLFVPTNTAFNNAGVTEAFIDANTTAVNNIVNYHISASRTFSATITNSTRSGTTTLISSILNASYGIIPAISGNDVVLNNNTNARILGATSRTGKIDQMAINGVIHEINAVLTPITNPTQTIEQITTANPTLNLFPQALVASGLTLTGASIGTVAPAGTPNAPAAFGGAYTVFVPTNQAFIDAGYDQARLVAIAGQPAGSTDKVALANILRYHVLNQRVFSTSASNGLTSPNVTGAGSIITLSWNGTPFLSPSGTNNPNGTPNQTNAPLPMPYRQLTLSVSGGVFSVRGTKNTEPQVIDLTLRNQLGSNGVFHVIPKVLTF